MKRTPFSSSCGIHPSSIVLFRWRAKGLDTRSTNSIKIWGWISSGPHGLFTFNFNILVPTISSVIILLGRFTSISLSRTGNLAFGSFVKTLKNCFWRIFVFYLSLNFVEVSSFSSCKRGATLVLVSSLLRTCDQNIFGLLFNWVPVFLSISLFDLLIIALILFLALVYARRTFSASEAFKTFSDDIHLLCSLLLFRITKDLINWHATLSFPWWNSTQLFWNKFISDFVNFWFKSFHNSSTDLFWFYVINFSVQWDNTSCLFIESESVLWQTYLSFGWE